MGTEEALQDIQYLKSLVNQARGDMARSAGHLVIWGAVWLLGLSAPALGLPDRLYGGFMPALVAAGVVASLVSGFRRARRKPCPVTLLGRLWLWSGLVLLGNGAAVLFLARAMGFLALKDLTFLAYFSAVWVGTWYMLGGFLLGPAMTLLRAWLLVLGLGIPLAGLGQPLGPAVLGVLGGGALLATGLLARRGGGCG